MNIGAQRMGSDDSRRAAGRLIRWAEFETSVDPGAINVTLRLCALVNRFQRRRCCAVIMTMAHELLTSGGH